MFGWAGNHRQTAENLLSSINTGSDDPVHRYGNTAFDFG